MVLEGAGTTEGVVTRASPRGVDETLERLTGLLAEKGIKLFAVIDHSGEARKAELEMPDT